MVTDEMLGDALTILTHELITVTRVVENAASLDTLISSIWTVFVPIALPLLKNAHVRGRAMEHVWTTSLRRALGALIAGVSAIICSVTDPTVRDTAVVLTLKLRAGAKLITVRLVRSVLTVSLLITSPTHGDASAAGTREGWSLAFYLPAPWTVAFVREVAAVVGSVTLPRRGKAKRCELTLLKCHALHTQVEVTGAVRGRAVHLIAGIVTVHFLVAFAGVRDAAAVSALELVSSAQSGVAEELIRIVSAVILTIAPGAVAHAPAVHTSPIALLTHTVRTVGLLLVRLVFAVGRAVTRPDVLNAVAVSTLKLIDAVAGCVQSNAGVVL